MFETTSELDYPTKIVSQTPTETSSEFNGQCFSQKMSYQDQYQIEDQPSPLKKQQNKVKYRKLKQKLNNMGLTHDQKCLPNKDVNGQSKQKIMKLALDFEKQMKMQNRDYYALEMYSKQLLKYLQARSDQQLHLVRQSRMIPAFFQLLQKVPMLHKNQFNQVLKTLEIGFKMLQIFATLSVNRDYLILTNRLNNLISLVNWVVGKQQKKVSSNCFFAFQTTCFKIVNILLNHKSKDDSVYTIVNTTLQLVFCSQIFRKIKYAIFEQLLWEGTVLETELVQQMLRFVLIVLRKSQNKSQCLQPIISVDHSQAKMALNTQLVKTMEFIVPSFISYLLLLYETQDLMDEQDPQSISFPNITINLLNLVLKIINSCFQISSFTFKRIIKEMQKQCYFNVFLGKVYGLIGYCKRQYEQEQSNNNITTLLNQIIVFVGYVALEDSSMQKKVYDSLIFEQLSNLPIQFMMDQNLRQIINPTICCLIYQNKTTLNFLMKDNSPLHIIKFLKKQIQSRPSLQRKNSTTSMMSINAAAYQMSGISYQMHRNQMYLRFPRAYCYKNMYENLTSQGQRQNQNDRFF